jgi:hypothetical protein
VARVRYTEYSYWNELSGGSRLPVDAAVRIRAGIRVFDVPNDRFRAAALAVARGVRFDPLILGGVTPAGLVCLEGHLRLTGYALAGAAPARSRRGGPRPARRRRAGSGRRVVAGHVRLSRAPGCRGAGPAGAAAHRRHCDGATRATTSPSARAFPTVRMWAGRPAAYVPLTIAGTLLGLVAGWLTGVALAHRIGAAHRRRPSAVRTAAGMVLTAIGFTISLLHYLTVAGPPGTGEPVGLALIVTAAVLARRGADPPRLRVRCGVARERGRG